MSELTQGKLQPRMAHHNKTKSSNESKMSPTRLSDQLKLIHYINDRRGKNNAIIPSTAINGDNVHQAFIPIQRGHHKKH